MPPQSSIKRLPPQIRAALDKLLVADRYTLDEIVHHIEQLGAEVSRDAVHRYGKAFREATEDIRLTREMARTVGKELSDIADGDATQLVVESLHALLLKARKQIADGDQIKAKDMADLARAAKDLALALRSRVATVTKIREETAKEEREKAAKVVSEAAASQGLTAEQAGFIRAKILGVKVEEANG